MADTEHYLDNNLSLTRPVAAAIWKGDEGRKWRPPSTCCTGGYSSGPSPSLFSSPWFLLTVNKCSPGKRKEWRLLGRFISHRKGRTVRKRRPVQTPVLIQDPAGEEQDCCHCQLLKPKWCLSQRKDETWLLVVTPNLSTCVISSLV